MTQLLAAQQLAGAVYSTVRDGAMETDSVGYFHAGQQRPMPVDAKINLGSVTKTLLSLAVLRLVSEGRLSLDAPVETLLPGLRFENAWANSSPVRLRHLLDHTAGLEDLRLWHMFSAKTSPDQSLALALQRDASVLRLRSEPGRVCSYSNLGYTLAAMVLESVVKERYENWADRELLAPLGMHDSSFGFVSQEPGTAGFDPRLAWGHQGDLSTVASMAVAVRPAGQFTSTAADMGRLMQFLLGSGELAGTRFIRPELMAAMGQASTSDAARAGLLMGYGLGLSTRDRHGAVGLCHAGSVIGYRAMMCVYREQQRAFFIALNSDSETADYGRFDASLIAHLGLSRPAPAGHAAKNATLAAWQGRYVLAPNRFEAASLVDRLFNSWTVDEQDDGSVRLTIASRVPVLLWPTGARLARQEDRLQASHAMTLDAAGRQVLSDGYRSARQIGTWEFVGLWASAAAGTLGLVYWLLRLLLLALKKLTRTPYAGPNRLLPLSAAALACAALLLPLPLFLAQPWLAIGDPGPATWSVYLATLALPGLMLAQAVLSGCQRQAADLLAALALLQACALLAAWGLLPLVLWH
ncbi:serine hydrolase domain-containing protein [Roseateles oligotrophus]|uniref:serine hydrolase domain-containing protein n=1 Tax=Roseateles oligotrophus TaxID=1769250 RepID=UPI0021E4604D|nr:serine hydrolase domain-containing protein [Roseateles oligotrophus]